MSDVITVREEHCESETDQTMPRQLAWILPSIKSMMIARNHFLRVCLAQNFPSYLVGLFISWNILNAMVYRKQHQLLLVTVTTAFHMTHIFMIRCRSLKLILVEMISGLSWVLKGRFQSRLISRMGFKYLYKNNWIKCVFFKFQNSKHQLMRIYFIKNCKS